MTNSSVVGSTFFGIDISGVGDQWSSWIRRLSKRVLLLEFGSDFLRLSETSITPNGIQLNHISRVQLPPEALERGVPADPTKMAGLLQQICAEKKIRAHRVAVVLLPEVGFLRIVELPAALSTDEARGISWHTTFQGFRRQLDTTDVIQLNAIWRNRCLR